VFTGLHFSLFCSFLFLVRANMSNTSIPTPFQVSPAWSFDGDIGLWSSFALAVGTPEQSFRVWPSTTSSETWLVIEQGCEGSLSSLPTCGQLRGVDDYNGQSSRGFQYNGSSSWNLIGIYTLAAEQNLFGSEDSGLYGLDTITLEATNGTTTSVTGQTVAGISTADYWLGSLGLGTSTANFTTQDNNIPSLLDSLKQKGIIPSLSFGYAAGAAYTNPPDYGSMILGGYDSARLESTSSNLSISLTGENNQTLGVIVQSIITTGNGVSALLPQTITAIIDSTVPELWLPQESCDLFAQAFGLTYDNNTSLYTLNSTQHSTLLGQNPAVTITIGANSSTSSSSATQNIKLPYAAFNLNVSVPYYNTSTPVFPLRVAANASQSTLGRTILQEAYLIVDWERQNFTIGSVVHSNSSSDVVRILPKADEVTVTISKPSSSSGIGTAAVAGIAVGIVTLVLILGGLALFLSIRRRRQNKAAETQQPESQWPDDKKEPEFMPELHGNHTMPGEIMGADVHEMEGGEQKPHEAMSKPVAELDGGEGGKELDGSGSEVKEGSKDGTEGPVRETKPPIVFQEVHELP
jgi:hypothetical protein